MCIMENGKTAIAKNLHNGFAFGSTEFHVLRANPLVNTKFVYYLLRAKQFRLQAKAEMTGAVGQQRVPKAYLENYAFPLPPKEEQDRIVEILEELNIRELKLKEISGLENQLFILKQSILNKAFRGELGTNDPAEESALTLLKEVLQEKIT
ncbi:restriction endonuclease subunit S [Natronobacillus azotifigens]|uniref:Restriction endonuclease subunit S n=1 Tax=Natronobacillus azotifigens TaxID=472978 RepID=A0A9J6RCN2_9BACI|nr:restriction endonuclease subunit S [Natronobacillus azotifigens]